MSSHEIDAYLEGVPEPKRATLEEVRRRILTVVPDASQGISYSMPVFRVGGKPVAGFAAFSKHLAYLPHSGSVFPLLGDALDGYEFTTGSLHFAVDEPLPQALIERLVDVKLGLLGLAR